MPGEGIYISCFNVNGKKLYPGISTEDVAPQTSAILVILSKPTLLTCWFITCTQ